MKRTARGKMNARLLSTIMLTHVMVADKEVTNQIWLNYTMQFVHLGLLKKGEVLQFDARVRLYRKRHGSSLKTVDYGLQRPTKISIINSLVTNRVKLPLFPDKKIVLIGFIMKANKATYLANDRGFYEWYVKQYEQLVETGSFCWKIVRGLPMAVYQIRTKTILVGKTVILWL